MTHITCWISHGKLVFSNMCLFSGIISCILMSPNIKIQDGHQRPNWKFNSKENSVGNWYDITFPINYCTRGPFLASFVYFDRSECQNIRWSPSVISIIFRFKPFDPLFLLNVTSETHFKQHLLISCAAFAHISTMITKKSRDKQLFQIENQSYLVRSLWIGVTKWIAMTMTEVANLLICMFIMVVYVNESFLIDMLVYQDWIRT